MAEAKKPFYVSFTHDRIPQQVDHSRSSPGPAGGAVSRAGYTSIRSDQRLTTIWDNGSTGADGRVPIFAQSINIYFWLTDFLVSITSDFAVHSCAYQATHRHELEAHIYDPIRIFHSYRDILVRRINVIAVPTREVPLRVVSGQTASSQIASRQAEVDRQVINAISLTRREIARDLRQASAHHDNAVSYRLVYNQCTDAQWVSGR